MGLDVYVYKNVKLIEDYNEDNDVDSDFQVYVGDSSWLHKVKNLTYNGNYEGEHVKTVGTGYSYSSHNRFREYLLKLVGRDDLLDHEGRVKWDKLTDKVPFYDFINFSDCEGCLDWETCERIYNDFEKYYNTNNQREDDSDYFQHKYNQWFEIFKVGKEKGSVVVFS